MRSLGCRRGRWLRRCGRRLGRRRVHLPAGGWRLGRGVCGGLLAFRGDLLGLGVLGGRRMTGLPRAQLVFDVPELPLQRRRSLADVPAAPPERSQGAIPRVRGFWPGPQAALDEIVYHRDHRSPAPLQVRFDLRERSAQPPGDVSTRAASPRDLGQAVAPRPKTARRPRSQLLLDQRVSDLPQLLSAGDAPSERPHPLRRGLDRTRGSLKDPRDCAISCRALQGEHPRDRGRRLRAAEHAFQRSPTRVSDLGMHPIASLLPVESPNQPELEPFPIAFAETCSPRLGVY